MRRTENDLKKKKHSAYNAVSFSKRVLINNEQRVCYIRCMFVSRRKTFPVTLSNMRSKKSNINCNITNQTRGPRLTANMSNGDRSSTCRYVNPSMK